MAKHILNNSYEDFDFVLIGMSCLENQYRLAALIDEVLGTKLFLSDYLPMSLKDGKLFRFSLFRYLDEELRLEYFFIPNTSNFDEPGQNPVYVEDLFAGVAVEETARLIKELPKTDFFLLLKGEELHQLQFKVMERLKEIKEIVQLQLIEPNDLPSKRNLIF